MFDSEGYTINFIQRKKIPDATKHTATYIYKFYSPKLNLCYIVIADYHQEEVFAVKFYPKSLRHSDKKYSLLTNKGDIPNILVTVVKVVIDLLTRIPTASFAFYGVQTYDKRSKKIEPLANNQRYRIYFHFISQKFGNETFAHFEYSEIGSYLMVNRKSGDIKMKERKIAEMFIETYREIPDDFYNGLISVE